MKRNAIVTMVVMLMAAIASAQSADSMQKKLDAEAVKLKAWAADPALVNAVIAQNNQHLTMAEITKRDEAWMAGKAEGLVKEMTIGACADRLRALTASSPIYGETFLMDNQGALVCANMKTSDYWQGDEAKWQRSFNNGKGGVFIDRPRLDESSKEHLAQISLPVSSNGKVIGAITVGIDITKLK